MENHPTTYPPRSGEILRQSNLTVIDDSGDVQDIKEVLIEQPGTDLILALSEEGEIGLYGAMSECLIYYLSDDDAPLFERIAAKLRERSGKTASDDIEAARKRGFVQGAVWSAAEAYQSYAQQPLAEHLLDQVDIKTTGDMEAAGVDSFDHNRLTDIVEDGPELVRLPPEGVTLKVDTL